MAEQTSTAIEKKLTDMTVKELFNSQAIKEKFSEILGNRAPSFIVTVLQCIAQSEMLAKCEPMSVYNAAATAATLDLPINPNLGYAAIIPYNDSKQRKVFAQFQIMWRGFVQLSYRSGQYRTINVSDVREGELKDFDRLTGEIDFAWEQDAVKRLKLPVIGYVSFFSLTNGFEKSMYMTIDELAEHGKRYSKSFQKGYGLWIDDPDKMYRKTMVKLILSRWGPSSVALQKAVLADSSIVKDFEHDEYEYPDDTQKDVERSRIQALIDASDTIQQLEDIRILVHPDDTARFKEKYEILVNARVEKMKERDKEKERKIDPNNPLGV